MKLIFVLALFGTAVLAQELHPFDFDVKGLKDIWEAPRLQPARRRLEAKLGIPRTNNISSSRIIGGSDAKTGQFPFQKLLVIDGQWWCGGGLVSSRYILTAGHCAYGAQQADCYTITNLNEGYYWHSTADKFIVHEDYDDYWIINDIALILLSTAAPNNFYTSYINLAPAGNDFAGYNATISGFGVYSDSVGYVSDWLRYTPQTILSNANCAWEPFDTELCTSTVDGDKVRGPCNGDSGGTLFTGDPNVHNEDRKGVGIVSFGSAAGCELGYPVVFTRITAFLPWIHTNSDVTSRE